MSKDDEFNPHVTVATVVADQGRYLLVEELVGGRKVLNQPAGHLDSGETLAEAAVRETLEETGHRVALEGLVGVYQWDHPESGEHFLRAAYAARVIEHDPEAPLDTGIITTHWLSRDEVERLNGRLRSPMVLQCIADYEDRALHPLSLIRSLDS